MFDIHCGVCDRRYLVGTRSIDSFHNTPTGPIASVRCPHGHHLVHRFGTRTTTHEGAVDRPAAEPAFAA